MGRDTETVSERVVQAVATTTNVDPLELPPLYDAIDPDALDAVIEGMDSGEVTFGYAGCTVTVTCEGTIDVEQSGAGIRDTDAASASF